MSHNKSSATAENKLARFGPLFIVITALLWSVDGFLRTTLYALPPVIVSFWEHFLGLFLIIPFFWKTRHELKLLKKKDIFPLLFIGFIAGPTALIVYLYALTQINFANFSIVVLLQQTQPLWAILVAHIFVKEPLTKNFFWLALVAMCGVYLIVFPELQPNFNTGTGTALAGALALFAAAAWGSATSFGKYVLHTVSFGTMTFLRFALASLFAFLLVLIFAVIQSSLQLEGIFGHTYALNQMAALTLQQWQSLAIIVLISGAAAMLLYYYGLKRTPARVATICELAWPASSLIIGIVVFKNTFTITQILGIIVLFAAMLAISLSQTEKAVIIPEKEI